MNIFNKVSLAKQLPCKLGKGRASFTTRMQNHPKHEALFQKRAFKFPDAASAHKNFTSNVRKEQPLETELEQEFFLSSELKIDDLKEEDFLEVIEFTTRNFSLRNPLCAMLDMTLEEIMELQEDMVRERTGNKVSFVVRDPNTGKVVGSCIPKVLTKAEDQFCVAALANNGNSLKLQCYHYVLETLKNSANFFEKYDVDKILELSTDVVHPEYSEKGVLNKMTRESLKRGKDLGCQLVIAQATNSLTQTQLKSIGFTEELDFTTRKITGFMIFDLERNLETSSFKVFFRLL